MWDAARHANCRLPCRRKTGTKPSHSQARKTIGFAGLGRVVGDYRKHWFVAEGVPRAVEKVTMIRSSSVLRDVSAAATAAVLALLVGLSVAVPAQAEDGESTSDCLLLCESEDEEPRPTETPTPAPPAVPAPVIPSPPPAPPVPAEVPTLAPEPSVPPAEETPSAAPSTVIPSPPPSSATPSTDSNWDKPITKSAKPTQAAAVSRNGGPGLFGGPGLLAIMAGVLLVGLSGLAFAWWSRNRHASH